jgi:hypothetical protein
MNYANIVTDFLIRYIHGSLYERADGLNGSHAYRT